MTERPPGLDALLNYVSDRLEEPTHCGRCGTAFDPTDTSFDGRARYRQTPWCNGCIDNCHEGSAEHVCVICREA